MSSSSDSPADPPRLCLFGAAPSTGNLGVSALFLSAVAGVLEAHPDAHITAFDFGWGSGPLPVRIGERPFTVERRGANPSKRFWRMDTLANMRLMGRLGGLGNPGVKAIRASQAVWDVSGGDSFTDLYGPKRFWTTTHPKFLAVENQRPLVLLPQTYGPFEDPGLRRIAQAVTARAQVAWARDAVSYGALQELLGKNFDPDRHRQGVDLAFGLPISTPPEAALPRPVLDWWNQGASVSGINVSGLIYLDPDAAHSRYSFRANYREVMDRLVRELIDRGERVLLVPHVIEPKGHPESDPEACERVRQALPPAQREFVEVLRPPYTASEVKSILARLDWFCGTRMHSTIGALSSGVPTAAVAYSLKFEGVFASCDQGAGVADPRALDTQETLDHLLASFAARKARQEQLAAALPRVKQQARAQMQHLLQASGLKAPDASPSAPSA